MKIKKLAYSLAIGISMLGFASTLPAAVSGEAAEKLGDTLTPFGAIKAGNDEGLSLIHI